MTLFQRIDDVYKKMREAMLKGDMEEFNKWNWEFKALSELYKKKYGTIIVDSTKNKTIQ